MGTSLGWRLRNSWWVLLTILGVGCLGGSGFLYIGITARKPLWWTFGIAYLVLPWAGLVAINRLGEDSQLSTAIAVAYFVLWFASVVHALILNGSWLRWRAANRQWFEPQPQPATALAPPPAPLPLALDVNTASAAALSAAGLDAPRAARIVADREARGGFQTVEEFAMAAALQPHEFARLRAQLTCTPRPRAPQPPPQGPGRVLDF
ncbi:helix-hairpin-helix domain-containing protein [Dactylosporangium vinaceum]|uniref:Helix-hairpin-helix domain-containing protein n=1 Tax=Dactylosporangium vinaceum TaxID=53362 RepID=A0ABV5MH75_9ACTN|nr:helix-hairpin-helix domain-containing protein [Dactylosporangium vinaceum]UAB94869.1 helix-hairpin-helix domain-containing protein [Dactylosporangium vinaceum]